MEVYGDVNYAPQQQVPYGSQELMQTLPLPPTSPAGQLAGNVGSFVPMTPAEALQAARVARQAALAGGKVAKKGARLVGEELNATMLGERPNTLLGAVTPQPMFVAPPSIAREGNPIQSAVVLVGDKIFTGRTHGDALNRAVYEGTVRKEGGKYIYPKGAEVNSDLFMTNSGQIIDRLQASKMFDVGASETAIEKGLMQNKPSSSMTVKQYTEQAKAIKKQKEQPAFQYPQQEALRLAQERASLPVEQGGLGLPKDNTPQMRYQAMKGIEGNFVHGAKEPDITSFKTKKQLFEEKYANNPEGAIADNHYANERNAVFASPDPQFTENFSVQGYTDVGQAPTSYPLKVIGDTKVFDFENPQHLDMLKQKYAELFPVKTIGREGYVPSEELIRMHTINKRIENLPNDVNNWPAMENKDFQRAIQELGFDAFHVNERGTKNIGVYDPSTLRSPFAAFDPFRRNAAIATTMGVAAPDLLASQQDSYSQNEMRKFMRQGR
tara:strand:- start:10 stop:1494 length:1485 start_codon:yes stop_codon:yes gene_type:complete